MPSKICLVNFMSKYGEDSIDRIVEMSWNPAMRRVDIARSFGITEPKLSKFISNNFLCGVVLHPELRAFYEELRIHKDARHIHLVKHERKILELVQR